jgi:hypothetical protein
VCPNSSNGEHNFQIKSILTQGEVIVVRVCILCNAEG